MKLETIDDIYDVLTNTKPDTIFAQRIWEGLANTFYYRVKTDPYGNWSLKMHTINQLASEYDLKIPSEQMQRALNFMNDSMQIGKEIDPERIKDLEYEFTRTPSRESAKNL